MSLEDIHHTPWYQNLKADRQSLTEMGQQLKWYYDADGMLVIKARLPAEAGQMFIKAIQAASEDVSEPRVSSETRINLSEPEISPETPNVKFRPDPSSRKADATRVEARASLAVCTCAPLSTLSR